MENWVQVWWNAIPYGAGLTTGYYLIKLVAWLIVSAAQRSGIAKP